MLNFGNFYNSKPCRILGLFIAYAVTARISLLFDTSNSFLAPLWIPSGITLTAFFLFGIDLWPGAYFGALASDLATGAPLSVAIFTAASGTVGAIAGAYTLKYFSFDTRLTRVVDVITLLLASILSSASSAIIGISALYAGHLFHPEKILFNILNWGGGDMTGNIVVGSSLFILTSPVEVEKRKYLLLEACLVVATEVLLMTQLFATDPNRIRFPVTYLAFPVLLWAALRFRQVGASVYCLIVCGIIIWKTTLGLGPFAVNKLSMGLLHLQLFLATLCISSLIVAALRAQTQVAIKYRDEFISIASHELKTPLTSLNLRLHFLKKLVQSGRGPGAQERIETTATETLRDVGRIECLINDLLDITKIASGRLSCSFEKVNLFHLTKGVIQKFSQQIEAVKCPVQISVDEKITGYWDPTRMEQVIVNLLTNALKYAPGKPIRISAETHDEKVTFVFQDFGPGIAENEQERIFRRFERGLRTNGNSGMGLGLYITKEIVEAHNGEIAVSSAIGHGSRFIINLPLLASSS